MRRVTKIKFDPKESGPPYSRMTGSGVCGQLRLIDTGMLSVKPQQIR